MGTVTNEDKKKETGTVPPPVISNPPEKELERRLQKEPQNPDAKADVGSYTSGQGPGGLAFCKP